VTNKDQHFFSTKRPIEVSNAFNIIRSHPQTGEHRTLRRKVAKKQVLYRGRRQFVPRRAPAQFEYFGGGKS
jgi:hypothetical protein